MLIDVKAQQERPEETGDEPQRFEFSAAERLSRLPTYFALAILGLTAYLRSIFAREAPAPATANAPNADDGSAARPNDNRVAELAQLTPSQASNADIEDAHAATDLVVSPILRGPAWPQPFEVPEFPQLHFTAPTSYAPNIKPFVPVTVMNSPGNDNGPGYRPQPSVAVDAGSEPAGPSGNGPTVPGTPSTGGSGGAQPDDGDDDAENNRAPTTLGPVRLHDVFAGQVVLIGLSHLLFGVEDADGDPLVVANAEATGASLAPLAQGWALETAHGMIGPVTISYRIGDGETWVAQSATLDIVRKQIALTGGDDTATGSPYDDDIDALAGNDVIDALAGNDHVEGGAGADHINGGSGDDVLVGGEGNDILFGGAGNDLLFGGAGDDRQFGEEGGDTLFGEAGNDILDGGIGSDHLDGGEGHDRLYGGDGDDVLLGGAGDDTLDGGTGDDVLDGGEGADRLIAGLGNDVILDGDGADIVEAGGGDDILVAGAGDDSLDGGEGHDLLDLSMTASSLVVDLIGEQSYSDDLGTDSFENVEQVQGGVGDDLFVIGGKASIVSGGRGRDLFVFEVSDHDPALSEDIVHQILDFVVGDRVRVRDYEIDRAAQRAERDMFEAIYGDDDDDWLGSDVPVQVRHERIDDEDWTIILADIDQDEIFDIAVNIQGVHLPHEDVV
jgi:Ca2+-binding RTX toxin-like protein